MKKQLNGLKIIYISAILFYLNTNVIKANKIFFKKNCIYNSKYNM